MQLEVLILEDTADGCVPVGHAEGHLTAMATRQFCQQSQLQDKTQRASLTEQDSPEHLRLEETKATLHGRVWLDSAQHSPEPGVTYSGGAAVEPAELVKRLQLLRVQRLGTRLGEREVVTDSAQQAQARTSSPLLLPSRPEQLVHSFFRVFYCCLSSGSKPLCAHLSLGEKRNPT